MLTSLTMFLQKISEAPVLIGMVLFSWIIYAVLFLVIRPNRNKRAIQTALIVGALVTLGCDAVWFFQYFDNFVYRNPGLKGLLWLAALPGALLLALMVQSYFNTGRFEHERKLEEKEREKLRKKESRRQKCEEHPKEPPKD